MQPNELKAIKLTLEKAEAVAVLLVVGNFVADGLDRKSIAVEDFIRWETILNKLLQAANIPMNAQNFLRNLDAVAEILAK